LDLISNKQRLEQDIRVKENSLKIDQQKCMTLRYQECLTLVYQSCMTDMYQTYKECRASMYQTSMTTRNPGCRTTKF
jgi:hypothetical protein